MKIAYFFIVILKSRIFVLAGNENYLSEFRNTFLQESIFFFYERFILNQKDKIELFFFFAYYRIYWNDKFIADTNIIYTFKHNLKLELHFNTNDEEQVYYSTIFFCAANLFMK